MIFFLYYKENKLFDLTESKEKKMIGKCKNRNYCHSISTNIIISILFLNLLLICNMLWGSTVGISVFMAEYYNVDQSSVKANMINGIFFIFYLIGSPLSVCFNLRKSSIIFATCTLIGLFIRIFYYIPNIDHADTDTHVQNNMTITTVDDNWVENLSNQFDGINAIIIGNAFLAFAQPFIMNYIIFVANNFISKKSEAIYIGSTSMVGSFGYAIGYMVSIYSIHSENDYLNEFKTMNIIYFIIVLIINVLFITIYYSSGTHHQNSNTDIADSTDSKDSKDNKDNKDVGIVINNSEIKCTLKFKKKNKCEEIWIYCKKFSYHILLIFTYAILYSIFNFVSNYLELLLLWKNFDHTTIFIASFINLVPGIPFPIIFGYMMDKYKKYAIKISKIVIIMQGLSLSIFLYAENKFLVYLILFILGAIGSSIPAIFLTLLTYLKQPPNKGNKGDNWNNYLFTSSTALTVILLISISLTMANSLTIFIFFSILQLIVICLFVFIF